jgi:Uma2 family endonuclease
MSAIKNNPYMSEAEYLEFERASETKHEYFRGEIYAMAGASRDHDTICQNLVLYLTAQARKNGCETHSSDMRLKVLATGLFTYPDFTIYCDELIFTGDKPDTLTNPTIIFEVLSPSTEKHDREVKHRHYKQIPSLQEYVLVAQDEAYVQRYIRQKEGWLNVDVEGLDKTIDFPSINASIALAHIYEQVSFGEETDT